MLALKAARRPFCQTLLTHTTCDVTLPMAIWMVFSNCPRHLMLVFRKRYMRGWETHMLCLIRFPPNKRCSQMFFYLLNFRRTLHQRRLTGVSTTEKIPLIFTTTTPQLLRMRIRRLLDWNLYLPIRTWFR